MTGREYAIADAFTDTPLEGNPVAVFLDTEGLDGERMQRVAREMNLSETTFVLPPREGGDAHVRIFTPVNELPFAGHPMLGTAVVLGERHGADRIVAETAMGPVPVAIERREGRVTGARMEQPVPRWEPYPLTEHLLAALGVGEPVLPVDAYRNGPRHVLVTLPDRAALEAVRPDLRALAEHEDMAAICLARTGDDPHDWTIRMFSPAYGVNEDAATGSAAGPVAIHLARYGITGWGEPLLVRQGLQLGRPSLMRVRAEGAGERADRVEVGGDAVILGGGRLRV